MPIDLVTYRKDTIHPQRWGYQLRGNAVPSSIIIHTTSNKRATRFDTEAEYLRDSKDVSAHFLVGKSGQVVQFLDPARWQAWHSGEALPAFLNARSIGIEHHVSVSEPWTDAQHDASTWLVRQLMQQFGITPLLIDTHRAVALPKGRKQDPAGIDDASFYAWRNTLVQDSPPPVSLPIKRYRVRKIMISQRREGGAPYAGEVQPGDVLDVDMVYADTHTAHLANGAGFVLLEDVEALS